jgi:hypothetical protein
MNLKWHAMIFEISKLKNRNWTIDAQDMSENLSDYKKFPIK